MPRIPESLPPGLPSNLGSVGLEGSVAPASSCQGKPTPFRKHLLNVPHRPGAMAGPRESQKGDEQIFTYFLLVAKHVPRCPEETEIIT